MTKITIEIENATYQKLEVAAEKVKKKPDILIRELLEKALQESTRPWDTESFLREKGRIRSQSNVVQNATTPPSLESVCNALGNAGGPLLEVLVNQRRTEYRKSIGSSPKRRI